MNWKGLLDSAQFSNHKIKIGVIEWKYVIVLSARLMITLQTYFQWNLPMTFAESFFQWNPPSATKTLVHWHYRWITRVGQVVNCCICKIVKKSFKDMAHAWKHSLSFLHLLLPTYVLRSSIIKSKISFITLTPLLNHDSCLSMGQGS